LVGESGKDYEILLPLQQTFDATTQRYLVDNPLPEPVRPHQRL